MAKDGTTIGVKEPVQNELRRYRAEDGLTYHEAIAQLLEEVGWIVNQDELLPDSMGDDSR